MRYFNVIYDRTMRDVRHSHVLRMEEEVARVLYTVGGFRKRYILNVEINAPKISHMYLAI